MNPFILPLHNKGRTYFKKLFYRIFSPDQYPGQALCGALYIAGGIRGVEIGSVMFGKYREDGTLIPAGMELVRLAIPRRVYTLNILIIDVFEHRKNITGYKIIYETPYLRHFTERFQKI